MGTRKAFRRKIKEQDEFLSTSEQMVLFVKENPGRTAAYVGAVLAILLLVWGIGRYMDYRRGLALRKEGEAVELYQKAVEDKTAVARAVLALEAVYDDDPGSVGGQAALYHAANLYFRQGDYQKAREKYRTLVTRHAGNALLLPLAQRDLAYTEEQSGNLTAARDAMEKLLGSDTEIPRAQTLLDLGRIFQEMGDSEHARRSWQEIVDSAPDSPYADAAREKLGLPPQKGAES